MTALGWKTPAEAFTPQEPSLPPNAQRFTYPFKVAFADASMFAFTASTVNVGITASMTAAGNTVTAAALLQLMRNPNPYILHGDTAHGGDWYLSVDLRVFQAKAGQTRFAAHVPTAGSARAAATGFIQQVLHNLNGSAASANSLFDSLPTAEDQATLAPHKHPAVKGPARRPSAVRRALHPDPRLLDEPRRGLFRLAERQAVRRGVFKSVRDLNTKLRAFTDGWNERAHPFVWTKTAEEILKKANRPPTSDPRQ